MQYKNIRLLFYISITFLLSFAYFQSTQAISYGEIRFVSDTSWDTYSSDPITETTISIGKAQSVCLNALAPVSCPSQATVYGYPGGWAADLTSILGATWIWAPGVISTTPSADLQQYYFSKLIHLPAHPVEGTLSIATDDFAEIQVNGSLIGVIGSTTLSTTAYQAQSALTTFNITQYLVEGENRITVRAKNGPAEFATCSTPCSYAQNPAGVVFGGVLRYQAPTSLEESLEPIRIFLPSIMQSGTS